MEQASLVGARPRATRERRASGFLGFLYEQDILVLARALHGRQQGAARPRCMSTARRRVRSPGHGLRPRRVPVAPVPAPTLRFLSPSWYITVTHQTRTAHHSKTPPPQLV